MTTYFPQRGELARLRRLRLCVLVLAAFRSTETAWVKLPDGSGRLVGWTELEAIG